MQCKAILKENNTMQTKQQLKQTSKQKLVIMLDRTGFMFCLVDSRCIDRIRNLPSCVFAKFLVGVQWVIDRT